MSEYLENKLVEKILLDYKSILGKDYLIYKNHVYRIYYLALSLDSKYDNQDKYAIASVFHDIGIWTDSFNYIEPSISLAQDYLRKNNLDSWSEEISLMIQNHHKMSKYNGEFIKSVETFRKADWVDVVMGLNMFGIDKDVYSKVKKEYPIKGFHWFLIKQSTRYFFKHPLDPLPMFKK